MIFNINSRDSKSPESMLIVLYQSGTTAYWYVKELKITKDNVELEMTDIIDEAAAINHDYAIIEWISKILGNSFFSYVSEIKYYSQELNRVANLNSSPQGK